MRSISVYCSWDLRSISITCSHVILLIGDPQVTLIWETVILTWKPWKQNKFQEEACKFSGCWTSWLPLHIVIEEKPSEAYKKQSFQWWETNHNPAASVLLHFGNVTGLACTHWASWILKTNGRTMSDQQSVSAQAHPQGYGSCRKSHPTLLRKGMGTGAGPTVGEFRDI